MRREVCVCPLVPELRLKTRVVLLMHWTEFVNTTNTGRLAALALPNSEIRLRGLKEGVMRTEGIFPAGYQPLFLYPGPGAEVLSADYLARSPGPHSLIVPDGTWRQAAKVGRREAILKDVPRVVLPPGALTRYMLRRAPQRHYVSTMEAIARALGILEGPDVQRALEKLFLEMVTRTLSTRSPDRRLSLGR